MQIAITYHNQLDPCRNYPQESIFTVEGPQDVEIIGRLSYRNVFNDDNECVDMVSAMQWTVTLKKMAVYVGYDLPEIKILTE